MSVVIGDVRIIGSTLWTDMENGNPLAMTTIEQSLNDYHLITRNGRELRAPYTIALHKEAVAYLESELEREHDGPTVVVTHHLPSWKSVHPIFQNSNINGAYASNLEHLMHSYDIKLWLHGHTHCSMDYEVSGTRVLANPFGYAKVAQNLHFDPLFRVEL